MLTVSFVLCGSCGFSAGQLSFITPDFLLSSTEEAREELEENSADILPATSTKKLMDILFVLDTSYSMVYHLQRVQETFKNFIPVLSASLAWKMAFTNADYNPYATFAYYDSDLFLGKAMKLEKNGRILPNKFLYSHSKDKEQIFLDTLKRYERGDVPHLVNYPYVNPCDLPPFCQGGVRNPIHSLIRAFSANKDFFRDSVDFTALIFTNGDNAHNISNMDDVVKEFQNLHGTGKKITVYSISIVPHDQKCLNYDRKHFSQYSFAVASMGHKVHKLVRHTGGKTMNICDPDYTLLAKAIAGSL